MERLFRIGQVLGLATLLMLGATLDVPQANAGEMLFRGRGFEDPPSAAAARTQKSGTIHNPVMVDFPGTGSQVCSNVEFTTFSDYPNAGGMTLQINYMTSGTSTNTSIWKVNLACAGPALANATCSGSGTPRACCSGSGTGNCDNALTITPSAGTAFSITPGVGAIANGEQSILITASNAIDETGCTSLTANTLQLCRDPANGSDTNTDTLSIINMRVQW